MISPKTMMDMPFNISKQSNFQMLRYQKIICFKGDFIIVLVLFEQFLVIVRRVTGPDFDKIFEVPKIIEKVLQYDRGPELAIWE